MTDKTTTNRPMFATYKCPKCSKTFTMSSFDWQWHQTAGALYGGCAANRIKPSLAPNPSIHTQVIHPHASHSQEDTRDGINQS